MNKYFFSFFIFLTSIITAQNSIMWQKTFGGTNYDVAYFVSNTRDSGSVVLARTQSVDGDVTGLHGTGFDIWVIKLNSAGNIQWEKTLGGTGDEQAYSIQQTTEGGYILAGATTSSNGDITSNHGTFNPNVDIVDAWLIKLDSTGALQWQKTIGGDHWDFFVSVQQTFDHGYCVSGYTQSNNGDVFGNHDTTGLTFDAWVVKTDSVGNIQWQKTYGGTGSNGEGFLAIRQTADSGYVAAGYTYSTDGDINGNHGGEDGWIIKLNTTGNIQWQKLLGGTNDDQLNSIQLTVNGDYIVSGITSSNDGDVVGNHGSRDAWAISLDNMGSIKWQHAYGGSGIEFGNFIQQTKDGGYIMANQTYSSNGDINGINHGLGDCWILKLDSLGGIVWQKIMGSSSTDNARCVIETITGDYIFAGWASSNDGDIIGLHGLSDVLVVKIGSSQTTGTHDLQNDLFDYHVGPSPCQNECTISYTLNSESKVDMYVLNSEGETISTINMGVQTKGKYEKTIFLGDFSSGVYILKIKAANGYFVTKVLKD